MLPWFYRVQFMVLHVFGVAAIRDRGFPSQRYHYGYSRVPGPRFRTHRWAPRYGVTSYGTRRLALTTNVMPLLSTPHTCQYSVGFFNVITDVPTDTMTAHSRIRDIPSD
ncbi:hypothetical protein IAQ61_000445, partial [Plenodomus lingam]|uniref:uncharacterized protein n=1 Tax=Leptosphaeria maculans TaxID=5022 RepID=UPI0033345692